MTPPTDPILDEAEEFDRFVVGEIANAEAYKMYKQALAQFWVAESCDLANDYTAFARLKEGEQRFLLRILSFFAGSDGVVLENIVTNLYCSVAQSEVRLFYGLQMAIENIHSEVYSQLIQVFEKDPLKRRALFRSIADCDAVRGKAAWAQKWMHADCSFGERLVAFAAVEGILFSASFASIFYLKSRGFSLNGLFQSNEYISRDEALHCRFACLIYSQLQPHNRIPDEQVVRIIESAVEVERLFVEDALAVPVLGMNKTVMMQYVRSVADTLLQMLGLPKRFGDACPFEFMNNISVDNKSNFFERRVTEYSLAAVAAPPAAISFNEEF